MPTGYSVHIGINSVDPQAYSGWSGPPVACEADAQDMRQIAIRQKFDSSILLTANATQEAVLGQIERAARDLRAGDMFLLTISSHGSQLPDANGDEGGPDGDGLDETWCLYNGELVDDELYFALAQLAAGVRIVVVADCCHSGTSIKSKEMQAVFKDMFAFPIGGLAHLPASPLEGVDRAAKSLPILSAPRIRTMPDDVRSRLYLENKERYDAVAADPIFRSANSDIKASAILLSGCQDNQTSMDGAFNGAFTGALKLIWNAGGFAGTYPQFVKTIRGRLPPTQSPNYFFAGVPNAAFERERPFTI